MASKMHWLLTLKNGTTIKQTADDWTRAETMQWHRPLESDYSYRCRLWTAYVGKPVVDWEWIDE